MPARFIAIAAPTFVLLYAACFLFRSPHSASELDVSPDSREYAVGAERLIHLGRFDLAINGKTYPPRYLPWFSALMLAPVYLVAPDELGNGVLPVFVMGLLAVGAVYWLGHRLAGPIAGVAAGMLILGCPEFTALARLIMTDVPGAALALVSCCQFVRLWDKPAKRGYLWAGLVVGAAAALRSTYAILLIPFVALSLWRNRRLTADLLLLAWPTALVAALSAGYDWRTFGDWRRNGYQYWCASAYDYPGMTFSARYLPKNLRLLLGKDWHQIRYVLGAAGLAACLWRSRPSARPTVAYLILAGMPIVGLYAFYFADDMRFNLLARALICVFGGALLALVVQDGLRNANWSLAILAALALILHLLVYAGINWEYLLIEGLVLLICFALAMRLRLPRRVRSWAPLVLIPLLIYLPACGAAFSPVLPWPLPEERPLLYTTIEDGLRRATPDNAVIITGVDEVFLEPHVLRGTHRRLLPFNRAVEYASKSVAPHRIEHPVPYPSGPLDARCPGLLRGGAQDVYPFTADEAPDQVVRWVRDGVPVFVDSLTAPRALLRQYRLVQTLQPIQVEGYPWLYRMILRGGGGLPVPATPPLR